MKKNVGIADSIIRMLLAIAIVVGCQVNMVKGDASLIMLGVATILVATSIFNCCPLYSLFKINTYKKHAA